MHPKCQYCSNNYKGTCTSCPNDNKKEERKEKIK